MANISRETGKQDLVTAFEKFGEIKSIVLKETYAFVDFESHEAAVEAVAAMDGQALANGEVVKVQ